MRKHLQFYRLVFGVEAPYNVILDGNFIFTAIKLKIDLRERLAKLLQCAEVHLFIMKSLLQELEQVGPKAKSARDFAVQFCELIEDKKYSGDSTSDRLAKFLGHTFQSSSSSSSRGSSNGRSAISSKRYLVASQDKDLRKVLAGRAPGVPLIYLNQVTLVLEAPSQQSVQQNQQFEASKAALNCEEESIVNAVTKNLSKKRGQSALSVVEHDTTQATVPHIRKKHKATAPNPLSNAQAKEHSASTRKKKEEQISA